MPDLIGKMSKFWHPPNAHIWLIFPQVCSPFTTGHRQQEGTFYEFCTYYLKPASVEEFLYNFKKNVHLRTAHSELVGYWTVGFGGRINTVFHIWKYGMSYPVQVFTIDFYSHRCYMSLRCLYISIDTDEGELFLKVYRTKK